MAKPVVVYMTSWCSDCIRSRRVLRRMEVPFIEIDIDETPGAEDAMRAVNGGSGKVPTILLGDLVLIEPDDWELRQVLEEYVAARIGDEAASVG